MPTPFDDETLGTTITELAHRLTGELEGLVIRYDPSPYAFTQAQSMGSGFHRDNTPFTLPHVNSHARVHVFKQ